MPIKKILSGLITSSLIAASLSTAVHAAEFKVDPAHSFVQFKIKHLGYSWLIGSFNELNGTLTIDENDSSNNAVSVSVNTQSLDTNHKVRTHLSKKGIINNDEFSQATFVSSQFTASDTGGELTGMLTINGVEKEVTLQVEQIGEGKDPWGGYRTGYEGQLSIDRRDFASDQDFGPASWEVIIDLYIEAIQQS